jgi:hypothetical protein
MDDEYFGSCVSSMVLKEITYIYALKTFAHIAKEQAFLTVFVPWIHLRVW